MGTRLSKSESISSWFAGGCCWEEAAFDEADAEAANSARRFELEGGRERLPNALERSFGEVGLDAGPEEEEAVAGL